MHKLLITQHVFTRVFTLQTASALWEGDQESVEVQVNGVNVY